jgi:CheY-like chemotaxis protein
MGVKKKILVVEDSAYWQSVLKEILNEFEVIVTAEGKNAGAIFKKNKDTALVIIGSHWPNVNGLKIASQIKEINRKIPVIMFIEFTESSHRDFLRSEADFCVPKVSELTLKIKKEILKKIKTIIK